MKKFVNPLPFFTVFKNFIKCGVIGWCMEILFTAFGSLRRREMELVGQTSLYMFPIYGCIAFFQPIFLILKKLSLPLRALLYAASIFIAEFASGRLLSKRCICPWDYTKHRWHVNGLIRLDFLPFWAVVGLLYEHVLTKNMFSPKIRTKNIDNTLHDL